MFVVVKRHIRHTPVGRAISHEDRGAPVHDSDTTDLDVHNDVLDSTIASVLRILDEMGIGNVSEDSVITAPPFYEGPVLLKHTAHFSQFTAQTAIHLRFVGYPSEEVAFLSVRQFCDMYVRDSFPAIPTVPLSDEQYDLHVRRSSSGRPGDQKDFPICFVLGSPRSGTTLLRAMLNMHTDLWAPGELHLANFATMADRAQNVRPVLRYMPIPEAASRCGESIAAFSRIFRGWELTATPVTEVFQHLHDADFNAMIVDKSPSLQYPARDSETDWPALSEREVRSPDPESPRRDSLLRKDAAAQR